MRSLIQVLEQKCGRKIPLPYLENGRKMEGKVSDFKNHQRFSLRCLNKGLTPVSLQLKNLTRTREEKASLKGGEAITE